MAGVAIPTRSGPRFEGLLERKGNHERIERAGGRSDCCALGARASLFEDPLHMTALLSVQPLALSFCHLSILDLPLGTSALQHDLLLILVIAVSLHECKDHSP